MYVRCIKAWRSRLYPDVNYGVEGEVYRVLAETPRYWKLEGVAAFEYKGKQWNEWVNKERFKEI